MLRRIAEQNSPGDLTDPLLTPGVMSDNAWVQVLDEAEARVDADENIAVLQRQFEDNGPVNIGQGQPFNVRVMHGLVEAGFGGKMGNPAEATFNFARYVDTFVKGAQIADPAAYKRFFEKTYGKDAHLKMAVRMAPELADGASARRLLSSEIAGSVELMQTTARMTRVGLIREAFLRSYSTVIEDAANLLDTGKPVPKELRVRMINNFRYAMLAEMYRDGAARNVAQALRSLAYVDRPADLLGNLRLEFPQEVLDALSPELGRFRRGPLGQQSLGVSPEELVGPPGLSEGFEAGSQGTLGVSAEGLQAMANPPGLPDGFDTLPQAMLELINKTPAELIGNSHLARVAEILDSARTNPKKAASRLRDLMSYTEMAGLDPRRRVSDADWFNAQMKGGNGLAKTGMLTTIGSQALNLRSNVHMAIFGPVKLTADSYLSYGEFRRSLAAPEPGDAPLPFATKLTRAPLLKAMEDTWGSLAVAYEMTAVHWRALFGDAFREGFNAYGGQLDSLKRTTHEPNVENAIFVQQLQNIMELGTDVGGPVPGIGAERAWNRTHLWSRKILAGTALYLHKHGVPVSYLQPGFRLMGATDNVAGYFFHQMATRQRLYVKGRTRADVYGIRNTSDLNRWVDEQMKVEFDGLEPTEAEVKKFRKDGNIPPDVSDEDVSNMIFRERMGQKAGLSPESRRAALEVEQPFMTARVGGVEAPLEGRRHRRAYGIPREYSDVGDYAQSFSEQMRFQDQSPIVKAGKQIRRNWWVDSAIPFLQAPLMEAGLTFDLATFGARGFLKSPETWAQMPLEKRAYFRAVQATSAMMFGAFMTLEAMEGDDDTFIIGNGPLELEKREAWRADLRAKGLRPNSILGIDIGQVPLAKVLLLWKDFKDGVTSGLYNRAQQAEGWELLNGLAMVELMSNVPRAAASVGAGQIERMPGIGQLRLVMNAIDRRRGQRSEQRFLEAIGYGLFSYSIPYSGVMRDLARMTGPSPFEAFSTNLGTEADRGDLADASDDLAPDAKERLMSRLTEIMAAATGFSQFLVVPEADWLGNPTQGRFAWGMAGQLLTAARSFNPGLWREEQAALIHELDRVGQAEQPAPLATRRLNGVPMTARLQNEFNTYLHSEPIMNPGSLLQESGNGVTMEGFTVTVPPIEGSPQFQVGEDGTLYTAPNRLPGSAAVEEGLKKVYVLPILIEAAGGEAGGKTLPEALRALVAHPVYQQLMANPATTGDPAVAARAGMHLSDEEQANRLPSRMVGMLKDMAVVQATRKLRVSDSPDAQDWRERETRKLGKQQVEESTGFATMMQFAR